MEALIELKNAVDFPLGKSASMKPFLEALFRMAYRLGEANSYPPADNATLNEASQDHIATLFQQFQNSEVK